MRIMRDFCEESNEYSEYSYRGKVGGQRTCLKKFKFVFKYYKDRPIVACLCIETQTKPS
jgi:hypothetical protein